MITTAGLSTVMTAGVELVAATSAEGVLVAAAPAGVLVAAAPGGVFVAAPPGGVLVAAAPAGVLVEAAPAGVLVAATPAGVFVAAPPGGVFVAAAPAGVFVAAAPAGVLFAGATPEGEDDGGAAGAGAGPDDVGRYWSYCGSSLQYTGHAGGTNAPSRCRRASPKTADSSWEEGWSSIRPAAVAEGKA
jgi:hypothetical protein